MLCLWEEIYDIFRVLEVNPVSPPQSRGEFTRPSRKWRTSPLAELEKRLGETYDATICVRETIAEADEALKLFSEMGGRDAEPTN